MPIIEENHDISELTTFKIGGRAKYYAEVLNLNEVVLLFKEIKKSGLPYVILGGGSNVVFSSAGFKGWVVRLGANSVDQTAEMFDVEAGLGLGNLIKEAYESGFGGLHKLIGIPGTIGGAIRGNAGAFGAEISNVIEEVLYFDTEKMKFNSIKNSDCEFGYRSSVFKNNKNWLVCSARFYFKKMTKEKIKNRITSTAKKRKQKPYYKFPSAGSIFKNLSVEKMKQRLSGRLKEEFEELIDHYYVDSGLKKEGKEKESIKFIPAGYLVAEVGLLGRRIGDAAFSESHGNFIFNLGEATSGEVIQLISLAKTRIRDEFGINLEEEVVFIG